MDKENQNQNEQPSQEGNQPSPEPVQPLSQPKRMIEPSVSSIKEIEAVKASSPTNEIPQAQASPQNIDTNLVSQSTAPSPTPNVAPYGTAPTLQPNNENDGGYKKSHKFRLVLTLVILVVVVSSISYAVYAATGSKKNNSTGSQSGLTSYTVSSGNPSYSIDFYKNSKINTVTGQVILQHIKSPYYSAYIAVIVDSQPNNDSCAASDSSFVFYSSANKGLGCYSDGGTDGYVNVNGQNYQVILLNAFGISLKATQSIFNTLIIH